MKKLYKIISKVIDGWSLSKAIFKFGDNEDITKYIKGQGDYIKIETIVNDPDIAKKYSYSKTVIYSYMDRINRKEKEISRKISILNIFIVAIISALIPTITFMKRISIPISIDKFMIGPIEEYPFIREIVLIYGLLQVTLITILLRWGRDNMRRLIRLALTYIIIYTLLYNIFTSLYHLIIP